MPPGSIILHVAVDAIQVLVLYGVDGSGVKYAQPASGEGT